MVRPIAVCVIAAVVWGAASGCGAGNTSPAGASSAGAASAVSKSRAETFARAVNLQAADVPAMSTTSPEGEAPSPTQLDSEENSCVGNVSRAQVIADIRSAALTDVTEAEHEQLRSAVEVLASTGLAQQNNAANRSERALRCAERFLPRQLAAGNGTRVRYGPVVISHLPSPLSGVRGSFGFRIAVAILGVPGAIEATEPHLYVDAYGFLSGPAEVSLLATAFPQPMSQATARRVLTLLSSRAAAHKL